MKGKYWNFYFSETTKQRDGAFFIFHGRWHWVEWGGPCRGCGVVTSPCCWSAQGIKCIPFNPPWDTISWLLLQSKTFQRWTPYREPCNEMGTIFEISCMTQIFTNDLMAKCLKDWNLMLRYFSFVKKIFFEFADPFWNDQTMLATCYLVNIFKSFNIFNLSLQCFITAWESNWFWKKLALREHFENECLGQFPLLFCHC